MTWENVGTIPLRSGDTDWEIDISARSDFPVGRADHKVHWRKASAFVDDSLRFTVVASGLQQDAHTLESAVIDEARRRISNGSWELGKEYAVADPN